MEMFSDDVVGIVAKMVEGRGGEGLGQQRYDVKDELKIQADHKANTRKNKLIDKKNKKLAKFKQNQ
jgi:hypothetical protein